MGVTIVTSKFSEETRQIFQEEANKMATEYCAGPHVISQYLAEKHKIAVSVTYSGNGEAILNCYPCS